MKKYVIIVAGGKGLRMGSEIPKQFIEICGKPVLMRTIEAFYSYDKSLNIILVLPSYQYEYWCDLCNKHKFNIPYVIVNGGDTRFQSVKNGLAVVDSNSLVAVHDGVRPFVSADVISECYKSALVKLAVVPVVDIVDSIRIVDNNGNKSLSRDKVKIIQTPQVFYGEILKKAYSQEYNSSFTDDASVVESIGEKIVLVKGNKENIKITTPFDLKLAELLC